MATKEKSKTTNNPALITGDIITWARERLGYSYKQVADEIGASVTADDIAQWEAEKTLPNFKKAQKLATALHIPFGYLFLSHRPKNDIKAPDLRTNRQQADPEFTPNLLDQLRNLLLKQDWYRDYAIWPTLRAIETFLVARKRHTHFAHELIMKGSFIS